MEAKMHKKLTFLLLACILCASFLTVQSVSAATQDKIQTMIIVDTKWDTGTNILDPTVWLYTESYVVDMEHGGHLDHQNLRYELYNPDGVLCEVQNHKTGRAWYNLQREICAKADFCGPFEFKYVNGKIIKWSLKVVYGGNDQFAPCEKTIWFYHDNYDYPWPGSK